MRCQCLLWSCRTAYSNLIDPDLRQSSSMRGVSGMLPPSLPLFHFVKLIRHSLKTPDLLLFHHTVGLTTALYLPCMLSSLSSLQHASNCHVSYSSKVNPHDLTAPESAYRTNMRNRQAAGKTGATKDPEGLPCVCVKALRSRISDSGVSYPLPCEETRVYGTEASK